MLRRKLFGLVLAGIASVAVAADKQITLEGGDKLTMRWGADWVVGDTTPKSPFGTLTIHGADATQWRLTLAPLPPNPTLTAALKTVRIQ